MSVGQKVEQNLPYPVRVDPQRRQALGDVFAEDLFGGLGLAAHRAHRLGDQRRHLGRHAA